MSFSSKRSRQVLEIVALMTLTASCDLLFPKTNEQRCTGYCDKRAECESEDASSCNQSCLQQLEASQPIPDESCYQKATCQGVEDCLSCVLYCDKFGACGFSASLLGCSSDCQTRLAGDQRPLGESCVLNDDCDTASVCILCDRYCDKLKTCGLSTSGSCSTSCQTVIHAGADVTGYQCVIQSDCSEVSNCGI